jgi:hypothetical protein
MLAQVLSLFVILSLGFSDVLAAASAGNCIATLPGTYTLVAFNTTLPNTIASGLPLMVAHLATDHSQLTYGIVVCNPSSL